jgi:hypothetical protein
MALDVVAAARTRRRGRIVARHVLAAGAIGAALWGAEAASAVGVRETAR